MEKYENMKYKGERALFQIENSFINNCIFYDGESPLKESSNLVIEKSEFLWKYPIWYSHDIVVKNSIIRETARSGIWYTNNLKMNDSIIYAPKTFRRCKNIKLENVDILDGKETFWNCENITLNNVKAKGDYFGMNSNNIIVDNFLIEGNYLFDGGENIIVKNSKLISKDAFWNCKNVTVENSYISGEYLCWNTKNIKFINCVIESLQGMCYVDELVLEDCELLNTTLAFEYSTVRAKINGSIDSIKNPNQSLIVADEIDEIILDEHIKTKKENVVIKITKGCAN